MDHSPIFQAESEDRRQLIITLSIPENEIIKIERLDEVGERFDVPDREFAALVGDHDVGDLLSVLEQVCVTENFDGDGDLELDDIEIELDDEFGPVVVRRVMSHRLILNELRKLMLGRLLRRASLTVRRSTQRSIH